jgi:thiol-disulfide isomerase/thioredoxin
MRKTPVHQNNLRNPVQFGKAAWLFLAMLGLAVPGCDGWLSSRPSGGGGNIDLQPVNAAELDEIVRGQRGRVVLIDFWATWCPPCRRLFPHTVALQREFEDQGLSVVTVSMDDADQASDVRSFLQENGAGAMSFIARRGGSQAGFEQFGIKEGIPFLKIYDRQGNLRKAISGPDEPWIDRTIRALLAEK